MATSFWIRKKALSASIAFVITTASALHAGALPLKVNELTEVADVSAISLSPNGRFVSFNVVRPSLKDNASRVEVVVASLATGATVAKADNGTLIRDSANWMDIEPPVWSKRSDAIYVRTNIGGQIQISRIESATGRHTQITHDEADVEKFSLSPDGKSLLYWVRESRAEFERRDKLLSRSGYRVDDSTLLYDPIEHNYWWNDRRVTMRINFEKLDYFSYGAISPVSYLGEDPLHEKEIDLGSRTVIPLRGMSQRDKPIWISNLVRTPDQPIPLWLKGDMLSYDIGKNGKTLLLRRATSKPGQKGFSIIQVLKTSTGSKLLECKEELCNGVLRDAEWTKDGDEVVFLKSAGAGDRTIIGRWNLNAGSVDKIVEISGQLSGGVPRRGLNGRCPIRDNIMVCAFEDATIAPRIVTINLRNGLTKEIYNANPRLSQDRFPRVETRIWKDAAGNAYFGKLVYPFEYQPGRRYPLVISTYNCRGFLRGGSGDEFPEYLFSSSGMMALCVNYSGPTTFNPAAKKSFREQPLLQGMLTAYHNAIIELDREKLIDPKKVGIGGLSLSSQAVEWTLWHTGEFAAASISAPAAVDPAWMYWLSPLRWEQIRGSYNLPNSDRSDDPAWKAISPALNVARIRTPLMINAAENEALAGIQFYTNLKRGGVPFELYIYPKEEHQIVNFPANKFAIYQRNTDWFRYWLQGYEDPVPEKRGQYQRWNSMKAHADHRPH